MAGLDDIRGLFQPKHSYDSIALVEKIGFVVFRMWGPHSAFFHLLQSHPMKPEIRSIFLLQDPV